MAKIRMRTRDTKNTNKKITIVRSAKSKKINFRFKVIGWILIISLILNGYLGYLTTIYK